MRTSNERRQYCKASEEFDILDWKPRRKHKKKQAHKAPQYHFVYHQRTDWCDFQYKVVSTCKLNSISSFKSLLEQYICNEETVICKHLKFQFSIVEIECGSWPRDCFENLRYFCDLGLTGGWDWLGHAVNPSWKEKLRGNIQSIHVS